MLLCEKRLKGREISKEKLFYMKTRFWQNVRRRIEILHKSVQELLVLAADKTLAGGAFQLEGCHQPFGRGEGRLKTWLSLWAEVHWVLKGNISFIFCKVIILVFFMVTGSFCC